jgi:hypothetical protein
MNHTGGVNMRRLLLSTGLAIGIATLTLAAMAPERATFVLTNGERVSGTIVFHTDARNNFRADTRQFSLGTLDGKEVAIQIDQIAVIDFISGPKPPAELAALKPDTHMLVMRDGAMRTGILLDFIGGDTIKWRNDGGGEDTVAIRDARRIYMSTTASRAIFNRPGAGGASGSGTGSTAGAAETAVLPDGPGVAVRGNQTWTDAGFNVQVGERYRFSATGKVAYSTGPGQITTAGGEGSVKDPMLPVPTLPLGALIGRVGTGAPFAIGSNTEPIVMPARGRLFLGINDNGVLDNSGGFRVVVTRN